MTKSMLRAYDFAGGTVVHVNWPFIVFALLLAILAVTVFFTVRKK